MKQLIAVILLCSSVNAISQTTFTRVYNLLQTNCASTSCHGATSPAGGLNLSGTETQVYNAIVEVNPANATALAKGDKLIDKGYPDRSFLLRKVAHGLSDDLLLASGEGLAEPNGLAKLADHDIELIRQWIIYGAPQTGAPVNYQRIVDYYNPAIGGIPKIARPPAPPAGQGFQIHMGPVFWGPTQESEYFQKYDPRFSQDVEVYKYEVYMNSESHHFILRQFDPGEAQNTADGLQDFNTDAFGRQFVNAWQNAHDLELPAGTGFFYEATTVFDLNFHMRNYHQNEILPGEVYVNVYTRPRGTATVEMKAELIPYLYLIIPGNSTRSFQDRVTRSGQTWNIWMLSTHTHKYGTDYDIYLGNSTSNNDKIYEGWYDYSSGFNQGFYEWSHPPIKRFNPLLPVNMSGGLTHKATYNNTGSSLVTWSFQTTGEMMLIYVQYTTQNVNYKPPVNVNGSNPGCNPVELSTDAGLRGYQWSNGDSTQTITVAQSGTYYVTVTDGSGTTYTSDPVTVTVTPLQVSINNGTLPAICQGQQATLNASTGTSYLWSTGAVTSSIVAASAGSYSVTVTDNNNCSGIAAASVTVNPLPTVAINDASFCSGQSASLDAGNAGATYAWSTGALGQSISVSSAGNYSVTVTDANGCAASDNAVITVHALPTMNISDITVCAGSSGQFDAGNPGSTYAWSTGETTRTVTASQQGSYSVTVTNANGCSATDQASLIVGTNLVFDLPDQSVCEGDSLVLDAGFPGSTYVWSTGATTQSIAVSTAATYSVTVNDANGCMGSDGATVGILPKPVANLGENQVICTGESVVLTVTGGASYLWTTGDATSSITVSQPGVYSVTVTAGNGCESSDKVDVAISQVLTGIISGNGDVMVDETVQYAVNDNSGSSYDWQVTNGAVTSWQGSATVEIKWNATGNGLLTVVETNADGCAGVAVTKQVNVGTTSITTVDGGKGIRLFPNPASSFITLQFSNPNSETFDLNVIDIAGKIVKMVPSVSGDEITISRGNLTEGLYFIELKGDKVIRQKVVIAD